MADTNKKSLKSDDTLHYKMGRIITSEFRINYEDLSSIKPDNDLLYTTKININRLPKSDEIVFTYEISVKANEKSDSFCFMKTNISFIVHGIDKVLKITTVNNESTYEIFNANFLRGLVSISISTARGVLAGKVEGTILAEKPYPLQDPMKIIPDKVNE